MARQKCLTVVERMQQNMYSDMDPRSRPYPAGGGTRLAETRWVVAADTVVVLADRILDSVAGVAQSGAQRVPFDLAGLTGGKNCYSCSQSRLAVLGVRMTLAVSRH